MALLSVSAQQLLLLLAIAYPLLTYLVTTLSQHDAALGSRESTLQYKGDQGVQLSKMRRSTPMQLILILQLHYVRHARHNDALNYEEISRYASFRNHQNKYHEKTLMEMTDWIVSISDIEALSEDQRKMYWYFANLYNNSNKGIKGRGKGRMVSNHGAKSRTAPSSYPVGRVPGPAGLAAYSSKRLPPSEQYMQQQHPHQHGCEMYDTDMDQLSSADSPQYDGLTDRYCDRRYDGRSAPY
ncbi:hypothetical protein LY76DRAFT_603369 [Colletotrichum caudatum]|nr:hypothetical protein LY76DRAFT_603369 [Colletotrichum caudatum]